MLNRWLVLSWLLMSALSHAEVYKYVDVDGRTHYVDDIEKIPPQYRKYHQNLNVEVRHFSTEELATQQLQLQRQRDYVLDNPDNPGPETTTDPVTDLPVETVISTTSVPELATQAVTNLPVKRAVFIPKMSSQDIAGLLTEAVPEYHPEYIDQPLTGFIIEIIDDQVFVPVILGYAGQELNATLLLDTDSTITVVDSAISQQLKMKNLGRTDARQDDGSVKQHQIGRLDYLKIGSQRVNNLIVSMTEQSTNVPSQQQGLLGRNVLRHFQYDIDLDQRLIRLSKQ